MSKLREAILGEVIDGPRVDTEQDAPPCTSSSSRLSSKEEVFQTFHSWALMNYGDSGKTKTVTRKKYNRIVGILTGEETSTADNSKFRFWVKGKGFQLGEAEENKEERALYVPSREKGCQLAPMSERQYKRVAVVENFFDIIYSVHVEMDGRGGKHAGQKRTYRAIAETYAFLPREAVTRFLMLCADCQKRMHIPNSTESNNNYPNSAGTRKDVSMVTSKAEDAPPVIDYSLPLTNTFRPHWQQQETPQEDESQTTKTADDSFNYQADNEDSMSSIETLSAAPSNMKDHTATATSSVNTDSSSKRFSPQMPSPPQTEIRESINMHVDSKASVTPLESLNPLHVAAASAERYHNGLREANVMMDVGKGHPERKRRASSDSRGSSTKASESAADDGKDDDDDNDDEDDDKLQAQDIDPERLKAFNMFVRLFVDENLDRTVPISKQPKDKVQAILEACDRQFPEFHIRSRKRVRTYLKSCRRLRRSKDSNGWDQIRPTPPHLTSAAAETILAIACENESSNAKRMRMGLEPLPNSQATMPGKAVTSSASPVVQPLAATPADSVSPISATTANHVHVSSHTAVPNGQAKTPTSAVGHEFQSRSNSGALGKHSPALFRHPHDLPSPFLPNGNGLLRAGNINCQQPAHLSPITTPFTHPTSSSQNGPTDLSMKKALTATSKPTQLNQGEVSTIKQLIAGYRESAAFLYRSADELEQLLVQQN